MVVSVRGTMPRVCFALENKSLLFAVCKVVFMFGDARRKACLVCVHECILVATPVCRFSKLVCPHMVCGGWMAEITGMHRGCPHVVLRVG